MQNKRTRIISAGMAAIFLLLCFLGVKQAPKHAVGREQSGSTKRCVAVITKSTSSAYWKSAFAGANAAATEYNLEITCDGPENEEDYETQNAMIAQAADAGAEVIVLSAVDFNANAKAVERAAIQGVRFIVIDSDVNSSQVSCRISTDNYLAGKMVGKAVLDGREAELYVGIVNFDENTANGQQREQGFRDAVTGDERVSIAAAINVLSTTADARTETKAMLRRHPEINAVVTFNEWTSLGVGYAIRDLGLADATRVVAFDSNVVSVGMLETGEVDALIVQNPYAMGYLGVECAYELINGIPLKQDRIDTTTTLVTRETMFDPDCQKILFSFD